MIKHNIGIVENKNNRYRFFDASKWIDDQTTVYYFISQRNVGKTTWMWNQILDDFINHGKSSIYMRRFFAEIESYKTDVKKILKMVNDKYGYNLFIQGTTVFNEKEEVVMELVALNTACNKSSGNFDNVDTLYFDEVQTRSNYLREEYKSFTDFVATCERHNKKFKAFMFCNALSKNNPYLSTWGIWDYSKKVMTYDIVKVIMIQEGIDVILPDQSNTTAYKLSKKDPRIFGYMYENKFAFDDDSCIKYSQEVAPLIGNVKYKLVLDQIKYQVYNLVDGNYWVASVFNWSDDTEYKQVFSLSLFDGLLTSGISNRKKDLAEWIYSNTKIGKMSYNSESSRNELFKWACRFSEIEKREG